MAYDEALAERARRVIGDEPGLEEKAMFGGLCWMVRGNMAGGIIKDRLCIRVGPEGHAAALELPHAEPMTFTGMALKGMVYVNPPGFDRPEKLAAWLERGLSFARSLPPKAKKKTAPKKKTAKKGSGR